MNYSNQEENLLNSTEDSLLKKNFIGFSFWDIISFMTWDIILKDT